MNKLGQKAVVFYQDSGTVYENSSYKAVGCFLHIKNIVELFHK